MNSSRTNSAIKNSVKGFRNLESSYSVKNSGGMTSRAAFSNLRTLPINTGQLPTAKSPGVVNLEPTMTSSYVKMTSMGGL